MLRRELVLLRVYSLVIQVLVKLRTITQCVSLSCSMNTAQDCKQLMSERRQSGFIVPFRPICKLGRAVEE